MKYRKLDENGDYVFGLGPTEFFTDEPAAPAQAVVTRLLLSTGEWFLDQTEGTPYKDGILGTGTSSTYDQLIQERILDTPGVLSIDDYASVLDASRNLTVAAKITTVYGEIALQTVF